MGIEWRQEAKNKNIQPHQAPNFEVVGPQSDEQNYRNAMQMVMTRATILGVALALIVIATQMDGVFDTHSNFAQFEAPTTDAFDGRLSLQVHSMERLDKIEGWLFDTKPQAGFIFIKADVSIINQSRQDFKLSVFTLKLVTSDGQFYSVDLHSRFLGDRLRDGRIKGGEAQRGTLLFRLPANKFLEALELRGGAGILASRRV